MLARGGRGGVRQRRDAARGGINVDAASGGGECEGGALGGRRIDLVVSEEVVMRSGTTYSTTQYTY